MRMQRLIVLGATGSIGASTLDLVRQHRDQFEVLGLSAHSDIEGLLAAVREFSPRVVCISDPQAAAAFRAKAVASSDLALAQLEILEGPEGLESMAGLSDADAVVAAIVGVAGLPSVWAAVRAGHRVLLANKEALVCAGALLVSEAQRSGAVVLPVDSEHNAIFQCLGPDYTCFSRPSHLRRLILTASGGPFREWTREQMALATVTQAVKHPTWSMGQKISVDSATLMNKGLELIEAHWLFQVPGSMLEVVVHPESVVHSMAEFTDGSTLAQLGTPDMRTPIAACLAWPERMSAGVDALDWSMTRSLRFEPPDTERFPALAMARRCMESGSLATNLLNGANEQAVAAFLAERISFVAMGQACDHVLNALQSSLQEPTCLEDVLEIDRLARKATDDWISKEA